MSAYLEVFILIGVAAGGSAMVLGAVSAYASPLRGPAVAIEDPSIRQGAYAAVEKLTVFNAGSVDVETFTLTTSGVGSASGYCYTLFDPANSSLLSSTCPQGSADPSSVAIPHALRPGQGVGVEITIGGVAFSPGSGVVLTVVTSAGGAQTVGVQVAPA